VSDSKEQIHGTITARAELDRNFARLIIEDVTSVMSKNLVTILDVMERQHLALRMLLEDNSTRLGKLEARMDAGEEERADLRQRLARIESVLDERPAARAAEHQAILDAITQAHADGSQ
jgi:hypothetical protein